MKVSKRLKVHYGFMGTACGTRGRGAKRTFNKGEVTCKNCIKVLNASYSYYGRRNK